MFKTRGVKNLVGVYTIMVLWYIQENAILSQEEAKGFSMETASQYSAIIGTLRI